MAPNLISQQNRSALFQRAAQVLKANDLGEWTKASPKLYPHQWSWDAAFIAIGLAQTNLSRALKELETLFKAQWQDGRVPHIVFNPEASDYFPGPDRWDCQKLNCAAPRTVQTSGIIQPPVHALAAWIIAETARKNGDDAILARLKTLFPKLLGWHRYLATARDPEGSGLISIYHPWESGTDNSPRWDEPLSRVQVGTVPPYERRDTKHVADVSERPTQQEYDRFLWLVESLKAAHYNDAQIYQSHQFIVKDALMSAIFALANRCLFRLSSLFEFPASEREEISHWEKRTSAALQRANSGKAEHNAAAVASNLTLDLDVRAGMQKILVSTCAGLCWLLVPDGGGNGYAATVEAMFGPHFAGHPDFKFPIVPSTTPETPGYKPRAYWRGPGWPVINWLFWYALQEHGFAPQAAKLKESNLLVLEQPDANFGEYFEMYSGAQLGSPDQSWTAAVVLDWLSN